MRPLTQRRLTFGLLSTVGALLMAEAAVSLLDRRTLLAWEAPVPVTHTGAPYLPGNPYLLWEMVPGDRIEMGAEVHVNSLGFRGPETTQNKPAGKRRILVLGDSTVYGHGVSNNEVFPQQLSQQIGDDIEVINMGAPGYSTAQSINLMNMRGWSLSPDLVIIANLWSDNNFDSFVDKTIISNRIDADSKWVSTASIWLQKSALYRWLDWHLRLAPRAKEVKTVGWMLGRTPTGGYRRVSVNDYAANLQSLVDKARYFDSEVLFLSFANSVDLGAETEGAIAWPLYREVMAAVAKKNGAPLVSVQPIYESSGMSWQELFIDEMHPSAAAHRLIAQALTSAINPWIEHGTFGLSPSSEPIAAWDDPFARGEGPPIGHTNSARVTLSGSIRGAPTGIPVQIDLIDMSENKSNSNNPMVGSARFDHVDQFEMPAPSTGTFGIRIYLDREADGPSNDDPVFVFDAPPIKATGQSIRGLQLDLSTNTMSWTKSGTTNRNPL